MHQCHSVAASRRMLLAGVNSLGMTVSLPVLTTSGDVQANASFHVYLVYKSEGN